MSSSSYTSSSVSHESSDSESEKSEPQSKSLEKYIQKRETHKSCLADRDLETMFPKEPEIVNAPIPLIKINKKGQFEICDEGVKFLRQIKRKVCVVTLFGPIQTGRSTILNLLVNKTGRGFEVGKSELSCTKGVWLWGNSFLANETNVIFIDIEGVQNPNNTAKLEVQLTALAFLLSSTLIYNTKGAIDERSFKQISVIKDLADVFTTAADSERESEEDIRRKLGESSPKFLWLLRDFHLSILSSGTSISTKDYLENILGMDSFSGRNSESYNSIRNTLLKLFPNRDCFTLPRPLDSEAQLKQLEDLSLSRLKDTFQQHFENLKKGILENTTVKTLNGQVLTGGHLVGLLKHFVRSINSNTPMKINTPWRRIIENEYRERFDQASDYYQHLRDQILTQIPLEEGELILKLNSNKEEALSCMKEVFVKDDDFDEVFRHEFEVMFQDDMKYLLKTNLNESEEYNIQLLDNLFAEIIHKLDMGNYKEDFENLEVDWCKAMKQFEEEAVGPGKFLSLCKFTRKNQHLAFSKFFKDITQNYEQMLGGMKVHEGYFQERLKRTLALLESKQDSENSIRTKIEEIENSVGVKFVDNEEMIERLEKIEQKFISTKEELEMLESKLVKKRRKIDELKKANVRFKQNSKNNNACCLIF